MRRARDSAARSCGIAARGQYSGLSECPPSEQVLQEVEHMVSLWGRPWTRVELLARVGRLDQVAGVQLVEAGDGAERAGERQGPGRPGRRRAMTAGPGVGAGPGPGTVPQLHHVQAINPAAS
jgi:hypothetical protein